MATTVIDEQGVDVGTTPTIYANQPPDKLVCKINYTSAEAASVFTLGGTIGGDATAYFKIVKRANATNEFWIACKSNRLPDDATGTITFDGPTGLTTLNPVVVSSQGRPIAATDGIWGLITTECWLRYKTVKDVSDGYFDVIPDDATFPNGDGLTNSTYVVTSAGGLNTKINGLATGSGQKYRIVCTDPTGTNWNSGVTLNGNKDFTAGGGYLLVVGDETLKPTLRNRWFITGALKGVEFRHFDHPGSTSFADLNISISGTSAQIVLNDINYISPVWAQNTWTTADKRLFVKASNSEVLRIKNCKFVGGYRNILATNVRMLEVGDNHVMQTANDFADATQDGKHIGRWADDNLYFWLHHNRHNNLLDKYTGEHLDFTQYSTTLGYPQGSTNLKNNYPATDITLGEYRLVKNRFYRCSAPGTTAFHADDTTLPSHTSGAALDGTCEWTYVSARNASPKIFLVVHHNLLVSGGNVQQSDGTGGYTGQYPGAQFIINSNAAAPWPMAVFNNFSATAQQRGVHMEADDQTERNFIEYNAFVGPHKFPLSPGYVADYVDQEINSFAGTGRSRAYKNITHEVGASVFDEGNVVIRGRNPGTGQHYWDQCRGDASEFSQTLNGVTDNTWRWNIVDDGSDTFDDTGHRLSTLFHSLNGRVGARAKEIWPLQIKIVDHDGNETTVTKTVTFNP